MLCNYYVPYYFIALHAAATPSPEMRWLRDDLFRENIIPRSPRHLGHVSIISPAGRHTDASDRRQNWIIREILLFIADWITTAAMYWLESLMCRWKGLVVTSRCQTQLLSSEACRARQRQHRPQVMCWSQQSNLAEEIQDAQLSQRDCAAGCVIVFAKSRTLELGDNDLRTL